MSCGLLQLVAYGAQDVYLTYNPQITFFKTVYNRHTNFAVEPLEYVLTGDTNFGGHAHLKLSKDGDLISTMYIKLVISKVDPTNSTNFAWTRKLGHDIIESVSITMGGTVIDRQTGMWLDIWHSLSHDTNLERGYNNLVGDVPQMTNFNNLVKPEYTLYIPLKFWFNKFVGLSI